MSQPMTRRASFSTTSWEVCPPLLPRTSMIRPPNRISVRRSRWKCGPALPHHVRDVQVAQAAVAELADQARAGRRPSPGSAAGARRAAARRPRPRGSPDPGRTVSSTGLPAVPASSGHGPRTGSTGCPSTATSSSPGRTATPGAASGERARGSDDSPGSTRSTSQRPAGSRDRSAPSWPTGGQAGRPARSPRRPGRRRRATCRARRPPPTAGRRSRPAPRIRSSSGRYGGQHAVPVHPGHVRDPEVPAHHPPGLGVGVPPQRGRVGGEPGPGQVDGDHVVGGVVVLLAVGRHDLQLVAVLDDQPGAVAADGEPVELVGQLGDLALAQVVALQGAGAARRRRGRRRSRRARRATGSRSQARPPLTARRPE